MIKAIATRRARLRTAAAPAALDGSTSAGAAFCNNRNLRLVLPLAPGGAMDVLGRGLANALAARLGTSFVVENRAGGNLAHELVAGEKPDGHTLLLTSNALVANVTLFEGKVRYDPVRSFVPVSIIARCVSDWRAGLSAERRAVATDLKLSGQPMPAHRPRRGCMPE